MANNLAVITGASAGIGKAMAMELAKAGYDLLLIARREEVLKEVKKEIETKYKVKVSYELCDLSQPKQYQELAKKLADHKMTYFINNAGAGYVGSIITQDPAKLDSLLVLLINSLTYLSAAIGAQMAKKGGGTIVNIASGLAYAPYAPNLAVYSAAKKYVYDISRAMNYENEKLNNKVRVVALQPGAIATEFSQNTYDKKDKTPHTVQNVQRGNVDDFAKDAVKQLLQGKNVIDSGPMIDMLKTSPTRSEKEVIDMIFSFSANPANQH